MSRLDPTSKTRPETPVVNSYSEWDPLEEVIVGIVDGACLPPWHPCLRATMPPGCQPIPRSTVPTLFPDELTKAARQELDIFVHILESEGVIVRRPDPPVPGRSYSTPDWTCPNGLYAAMPRDLLFVFGNDIIEAPMAWRSRYFEVHAYRSLLKDYFRKGAQWTAAPKPQLLDDLYDSRYVVPHDGVFSGSVLTEFEPTFDAADFVRCGRDVFYQKSHVTNEFGVEWLRRHLEGRCVLHELRFRDSHPMHIDATFLPLAPGKVLVNDERVDRLPDMFHDWEVLSAPPPCIPKSHPMYLSSRWVSMNVLMLDEKRVIVEREEEALIASLRRWGFEPIPCPFRSFNSFGGSFHCATLDVRRRGEPKSYF